MRSSDDDAGDMPEFIYLSSDDGGPASSGGAGGGGGGGVEVTGVTGDDINQLGWASVCTMVSCQRPSNLTTEFYDERGRGSTNTSLLL